MARALSIILLRGARARRACYAALALLFSACAATPPPDASGPRPGEPTYPVTMLENSDRRQTTITAWERLLSEQGVTRALAPELQPVTASVRSLPSLNSTPLYLPKVGDDANAPERKLWEDATTESLRRFINSYYRLLGAEPQQLSLVLLTDAADGTKRAKYQQRPFRYPLRNGFGELEISFTADRRILQINSTCIPEIEQLQRAGAGIRPRYSPDEVARRLIDRTITYTGAAGSPQTHTIQAGEEVTVRELVVYPILRPGQSDVLEFHLAWEIIIGREVKRTLYLDAVTDEIIAVNPS